MTELSINQRAALETLTRRGKCSAYEASLQMRTLEALERKGSVQARRGVGSMFSPTTVIKWWITDTGKAAIFRLLPRDVKAKAGHETEPANPSLGKIDAPQS